MSIIYIISEWLDKQSETNDGEEKGKEEEEKSQPHAEVHEEVSPKVRKSAYRGRLRVFLSTNEVTLTF